MKFQTDKAALRGELRRRRDEITPADRAKWEAALTEQVFALPAFQNASVICGYVAVRGEIDLTPVWRRADALGKTYALPCTVTDGAEGRMIFRAAGHPDGRDLIPGRYGIREPSPDCRILTMSDLSGALMIVPGLGFDDQGFRIGYGGGYYDRFLAEADRANSHPATVGLVFSVCRVPCLPHEPHDRAVDRLIDERSVTVTHG